MKRLRILSVLMVLFSAIGFVSCETEPLDPALLDNVPVTPAGPSSFKVDFSGQTFIATTTMAFVEDGVMGIAGMRGTNGEAVSIVVMGTTTGTYTGNNITLSYEPSAAAPDTYDNFNPTNSQNTGTVSITSINTTTHTISGTFSFTGYYTNTTQNLPSVAFSSGVFTNIPYTGTIPPVDPEPSDEPYFTAKVDGTDVDYSDDTTVITSTIDEVVYTNILGSDTNSLASITLNLHGIQNPGTYEIGSSMLDDANASWNSAEGNSYPAESGILTILSNEGGWIIGTFSFVGVGEEGDLIPVTNGTFKVEN